MVRFGLERQCRQILVASAFALVLLGSTTAAAFTPLSAGSVHLSTTASYGGGAYTVEYDVPASAAVGTNLTIPVKLTVNDLTGMNSYILRYFILVTVYIDLTHVLTGKVGEPTGAQALYAGGHWGPYNVTIPLTENNTGIPPGKAINATVAVALQDQMWVAYPYDYNFPEASQQGPAGFIIIHNGEVSSFSLYDYLPYAALAGGAVLAVIAAGFWVMDRKKNSQRAPTAR